MWYQLKGESLFLAIKVKPNSSKTAIVNNDGDQLKISIKALPIAGKANQELVNFLSKSFKIPKKLVVIVQGEHSKEKLVQLPYNNNVKNILERIIANEYIDKNR